MDWGFIVFVGTLLFFAALHQWPPQREEITIKEQEARQRQRRRREPSNRRLV